ncbi:MAG: M48 family metalloprotease [Desulfamplus sp.]|nr:M48 family metalloprotease [Desulfamplus sp.]
MFSNFIYILVALILYSTSEFQITADHSTDSSLALNTFSISIAIALFLMFWLVCYTTFKRLERHVANSGDVLNLDHLLEKSLSRLSILALLLFAWDLYFLRLNLLFDKIWLFKIFPTIEAIIFLSIFILYLVVIWNCAWNIQQRYFTGYVSKKSFVASNISFSLPALLPWFILSITADIIELIPFEQPKGFLATPQGEILYVLMFMLAVACFGPLLIQKIWGCTSLEDSFIRTRIEELCKRAKLKYADILKWELFGGSMITAGVMGLWGKFRYILVTPAMIKSLLPDEIDAVIVHEIGHIQNRHIHFYLLFFAGYIASIYSLFDPVLLIYYVDPIIKIISFIGIKHETGITLILSMIMIVMFLIYFRYIFGFFMRNFERQADIHVYRYLPDASALIRTFYKIVGINRHSWDKPNWHHYSIKERVDFLNLCELNPEYIQKHHKRVRLMMQTYIVVMIFICLIGYYFNIGQGKEKINEYLAEKIINEQVEGEPENIDILLIAADYYYNKERFDKAVYYYNKVISISNNNSHALNNLAWLYATCPNIEFQNPQKALELATRALEATKIETKDITASIPSHILDTYAEACFLNGLYEEALEAAKDALKNATDKKDYYQKQVNRFSEIRFQSPKDNHPI